MTVICLFKHEVEPAQNMKPGAAGEKQVSKEALKKQKRREAKKAAKQARDYFEFPRFSFIIISVYFSKLF